MENNKRNRFTNIQYILAYKQFVPDDLQQFLRVTDFYENLSVILTEAYNEGYRITSTGRKIVKLRFISNRKIGEVKEELKLTDDAYKREWKFITTELRNYLLNVYEYPLRVAILKVKSLSRKTFLKKFYKLTAYNEFNDKRISVFEFLRAVNSESKGMQKKDINHLLMED